jgi:hypothetical protein
MVIRCRVCPLQDRRRQKRVLLSGAGGDDYADNQIVKVARLERDQSQHENYYHGSSISETPYHEKSSARHLAGRHAGRRREG